jgi:putative ribosome biogenesis GTPase RsgA
MFIVGNKTDLGEERTVSLEGVEEKYKQIGAHFIEVSAKTGHNL